MKQRGFIEWVLIPLVGLCMIFALFVFIKSIKENNRPTFELKKDDWECVKDESRTSLQPILAGKVTVMVPRTTMVCVEYRKKEPTE